MQSALVITLARGYVQVRAAHAHFDAMKIFAAIRVLRLERDGVLIARLFGDGGVQIFQSAILAGVKSIAAGGGGISLEARALLLAKRVAHGNGINGNIGLQQELQSLVQRVFVAVGIISIRNQENNLATIAPTALEHLARRVHGVVHVLILFLLLHAERRRRSRLQRTSVGSGARRQWPSDRRAGIMRMEVQALELREEEIVVERKFRYGVGKLIVGYQRHFIVRPESTGDCSQAFLHLVGRFYREIVINQHDGGERVRVGGKVNNLLFNVVAEHAELVLLQIADQLP